MATNVLGVEAARGITTTRRKTGKVEKCEKVAKSYACGILDPYATLDKPHSSVGNSMHIPNCAAVLLTALLPTTPSKSRHPFPCPKNSVLGLLTPMGGGRTLGQFFLRWDLWGTEIYSSTKKNKSWCRKYGYENATELRKPWKQWKKKQSGSWTWWKVWLTQGFWRFPSVCFGENLLVCFSTMMKLIQLYFFSRFKRNCVFFEFKSQITLDSFCVYK